MALYLIAIGGSGAKGAEAMVHLAASGAVDVPEMYILFVDPDQSNGSLGRAQLAVQEYRFCQGLHTGRANNDLFRVQISTPQQAVWNPFRVPDPSLRSLFQYDMLRQQESGRATADLMDVLYSSAERDAVLDRGFLGHPSIGAAVMAKTLDLAAEGPWRELFDRIQMDTQNGKTAHVVLMGSVFGGTGASGIPTIARLIKNACDEKKLTRVLIGSVLMLPYFSFTPPQDKDGPLWADPRNFMYNSQMALHYYHLKNQLNESTFRAIYPLGEDRLSRMQASALGKQEQTNEPHFIELYAALAAAHFTKDQTDGAAPMQMCRLVARGTQGLLGWPDLPGGESWQALQKKLRRLLRFAVSFVYVYRPMLQDIEQGGRAYRAPWYIDHFERHGQSLARAATREGLVEQLNRMESYCRSLLLWWAWVQNSAPSNSPKVELVNATSYAKEIAAPDGKRLMVLKSRDEFAAEDFPQLLQPTGFSHDPDLASLWEMVSNVKVRDNADGAGWFFQALFDQCAR
ncbi:MAG: hypothetical protein U0Q16_25785 [Bryobacteraceae bacterium]